jgi:hypothetical protein
LDHPDAGRARAAAPGGAWAHAGRATVMIVDARERLNAHLAWSRSAAQNTHQRAKALDG